MKRNLKTEIDAVRLKAGLEIYDKALTPAKCDRCSRVFYWRVVPGKCSWPTCGGTLKAEVSV